MEGPVRGTFRQRSMASSRKQLSKTIIRKIDDENRVQYSAKSQAQVKKSIFKRNTPVVWFMNWGLKTSFTKLIVAFTALYYVSILLFCIPISLITNHYYSKYGRHCTEGWDYTHEIHGNNFGLSFDLSWNTFSTVGYGVMAPSPVDANCFGMRFTMALEAYIGIMFVGIAGSLIFSKLSRYQSVAHVTFSSTVVVQYGADETPQSFLRSDFPVLEFRVVNDRANKQTGGIVDATLTAAAILQSHLAHDFTKRKKKKSFSPTSVSEDVQIDKQGHYPLRLEIPENPLFRKIWYGRHVLDGDSPLLNSDTKELIKANNGKWPERINTHELVRKAIVPFSQILVYIEGTSDSAACNIFERKLYSYTDMYIGWQFAIMFQDKKKDASTVEVDLSLIHDILPQRQDGSAEPIQNAT